MAVKTVYRTDDGQEFESYDQAEKHMKDVLFAELAAEGNIAELVQYLDDNVCCDYYSYPRQILIDLLVEAAQRKKEGLKGKERDFSDEEEEEEEDDDDDEYNYDDDDDRPSKRKKIPSKALNEKGRHTKHKKKA